jgi:hypothetical protein
MLLNLYDQPKLEVQSHRALMASFAFQFLVMQRLHLVEVPLVIGISNDLHLFAKLLNDVGTKPGRLAGINFKPFQLFIVEPNPHHYILSP